MTMLFVLHTPDAAVEDRNYEALAPLMQSVTFDEHRPCDPLDECANSIVGQDVKEQVLGFS